MHLAIMMWIFSLWNAMAVLHSDYFECHHNDNGFIVAITRAAVHPSVCIVFPSTLPVFYKWPLPTKSAANSAELSVEFSSFCSNCPLEKCRTGGLKWDDGFTNEAKKHLSKKQSGWFFILDSSIFCFLKFTGGNPI